MYKLGDSSPLFRRLTHGEGLALSIIACIVLFPIAVVLHGLRFQPSLVFALNLAAIVPLAALTREGLRNFISWLQKNPRHIGRGHLWGAILDMVLG